MKNSSHIDSASIERIAELSKLSLSVEQKDDIINQLTNIISSIDIINSLELDDIEPLEHIVDLPDIFREDCIKDSLSIEDTLKNAPQKNETFFKVPKVLE
jgi:aspartyl-tRNA(Asn)/glutamyl-tRNA(Gln) amidotransferase subunit C